MRKYGFKALAIATAMSMVLSSPLQVFAKRRANTAGSWKQSGENWSFLDEKGQNVLGWIYENGSWYYVDPKTGTLRSGWLYLEADPRQHAAIITKASNLQLVHRITDGFCLVFQKYN